MNGFHRENQNVAGLVFGSSKPAASEFFAQADRIFRKRAVPLEQPLALFDLFRKTAIDAVLVHVPAVIVGESVGLAIRAFQYHESSDVQRNIAERCPGREDLVRATTHINDVAMRWRAEPRTYDPKP